MLLMCVGCESHFYRVLIKKYGRQDGAPHTLSDNVSGPGIMLRQEKLVIKKKKNTLFTILQFGHLLQGEAHYPT